MCIITGIIRSTVHSGIPTSLLLKEVVVAKNSDEIMTVIQYGLITL